MNNLFGTEQHDTMDAERCGDGKPQGPGLPHWDFWC